MRASSHNSSHGAVTAELIRIPLPGLRATICVGALLAALGHAAPALAQTDITPSDATQADAGQSGATPGAASSGAATQSASDQPTEEEMRSYGGDIVVVAQRRAQQLQDVPISITARTGEDLAQAGIGGTERLTQVTPGLNYTRNAFFAQPYIRGVGASTTSIGDEPNVATYVDGVYISSLQAGFMNFLNVDHVEVLKGPQGTLFGRNATGGAINVITRLPTQDPELRLRATYARFNELDLQAYAAGGLGEGVALGVAGAYERRGNYIRNITLNREVGERENYMARARLLLDPAERLRIVVTGDISRMDDPFGINQQIINRNSRAETGVPPINTAVGNYETLAELLTYAHLEQQGIAGEVTYDAEPFSVISVTSFRHLNFQALVDSDSTPSTTVRSQFLQNNSGNDFQQELRLVSKPNSPFDWLIGAYYFNSRTYYDPLNVLSSRLQLNSRLETNAYAVFADVTVPLGAGFSITGGARYSYERKELFQSLLLEATNTTRTSGPRRVSFDSISPRAVLQYRPGDNDMLYASYSRGFKSGGFNQSGLGFISASGIADPPYDPETINAYEVGWKHTLRGGIFNVAAFHYDYSDLQVQITTPPPAGSGTAIIQNAASVRVNGAEAEFSLNVTRRLSVRFAGAYLDAEYSSFPNAIISVPRACPAGVPACGNNSVMQDVSGNPAVRSPKWTLTGGLVYRAPLGGGYSLNFSGNAYYNSGFAWEASNRVREDDYTVINAQLELASPGDRWTVAAFVRNLTDERYYALVNTTANEDRGQFADPRVFGVTVGLNL